MKKIYVILCSIALSTLTFIVSAQTTSEEMKYKNDVGFNTTFLFTGIFNSGETPFTLMYKKYKDNNNPLRLGLSAYVSIRNNNYTNGNNYSKTENLNISFSIGKEFQKEINKNWVWYFGADIIPTIQYNYREDFYSNGTLYQSSKYTDFGLGFMPFLGVRFNINERLYLSTEFSVGPKYSYGYNLNKWEDPETILQDTEGGNFNFSMNPAYGLFLYYRF